MGRLIRIQGRRPRTGVVGYAAGAFDLFHVGHLNVLTRSAAGCDHLVAGVVSDEVLRQTKNLVPVVPEAERVAIVAAVACVDSVYIETDADRVRTWQDVGFDVFFKGDDWKNTPRGRLLESRLGEHGVRVEYFPYTETTSSTRLRMALDAMLTDTQGGAVP